MDEAKALYEWNYRKQLLYLQAGGGQAKEAWKEIEEDIFGPEFLIERPVLKALRREQPAVLLIDEVDRIELETEALLLEALSEYQMTIPELGTIAARSIPMVILTSNATRDLSEALRRRCLFLYLGYPPPERERAIIAQHVPGLSERLAARISEVISALRGLDLAKPPSISEAIDWGRALHLLGAEVVDEAIVSQTLNVLIKSREDIASVSSRLGEIAS